MPIDGEGLSRLVPELALVIIFVWFTLERDKRESENDKAGRVEQLKFLDVQRTDFLSALREDNVIYREGMARIAEEVKGNTNVTRELLTLLSQHDQQAREFIHRQEKK